MRIREQDQIISLQQLLEANEQPGGIITITYRAENKSNKEQKLTFTSRLQADAILYEKSERN